MRILVYSSTPDNFGIETEVVFERNGSVDGYNRISELLIREYT